LTSGLIITTKEIIATQKEMNQLGLENKPIKFPEGGH
jgi:hypothetical protein